MSKNYEAIPLFSPATARALWVAGITLGFVSLSFSLWGWLSRGQDWTTVLGPLGVLTFILAARGVMGGTRGRLYPALWAAGAALLAVDVVLKIARSAAGAGH